MVRAFVTVSVLSEPFVFHICNKNRVHTISVLERNGFSYSRGAKPPLLQYDGEGDTLPVGLPIVAFCGIGKAVA